LLIGPADICVLWRIIRQRPEAGFVLSPFDLAGSFPGCSDAASAGSHRIANKVTLSGTIASGIGWQGRPESHPHGDPMK
jgi:hypothetical protein